jgi:hypothetical protein
MLAKAKRAAEVEDTRTPDEAEDYLYSAKRAKMLNDVAKEGLIETECAGE